METQQVDYKDWLYRFLGIYRYHSGTELTETELAVDYLRDNNFTQEQLDEIWKTQVERNIQRDKLARAKKPFKRDSHNVNIFFKKKHYANPLQSTVEALANEERKHCRECEKEGKHMEEFPHFQNPEHLCSWHYSKKHYSGGPTGLNALREVFIRLGLQQQQGETREAWITRLKSIARAKAKTLGQVQRKGTGEHQPVPENIQRQSNAG